MHIDGSLDTSGTLEAQFTLEEHGDGEVALRAAYRATPQNNWQELTQKLAGGMGYRGEVSEVSVTQPEDTGKTFTIAFHYHRTDFPDWKNRRIVLGVPYFFVPELTEDQKLSKDDLPLGALQDVTYISSIVLPMGFTAVLPERVERENAFASFSAKYSTGPPNAVHLTFHLQTFKRAISGEERAAFNDFSKTVRETPERYVFIKGNFPANASVSPADSPPLMAHPGDSAQVIARLEQLAEASPDNEQIRGMLVRAYIAEKQPEKALAILDKTKTQNPAGTLNLNILYGKTYLAMKDSEKAFQYFQKALGGDPNPLC